jgi:sugar lactone lactonase YvrE
MGVSTTSIFTLATLSVTMAFAQTAKPAGKFRSEGIAVHAEINGPMGLALYESRYLYVAEAFRNVIRRVDLETGMIYTVQVRSKLEPLGGISVDSTGSLIVTEFTAERVRKIRITDGTVSLLAGNGQPSGVALVRPGFVTTDTAENVYIADMGRIFRLDTTTGNITIVVATGESDSTGGGTPATLGGWGFLSSVAVDDVGNLFVSQYGNQNDSHRICRVDRKTGVVQTIAGGWRPGLGGDGGPARSATLQSPSNLLLDSQGNLFVLDPVNDRVRRIDAKTGVITTIAGSTRGFGGDGGPAVKAKLNNPSAMAIDSLGNLYIAEFVNNSVRRVDARTGVITTVAGNGLPRRIDVLM